MPNNTKKTSKKVASEAAKTLRDPKASSIQKSLAASALSQVDPKKQTGSRMEEKAARALQNDKSADLTQTLAGSVTSQSKPSR